MELLARNNYIHMEPGLYSGVTIDWCLESLRSLEAGAAPESGGRSLELLRSIQITIYIWATNPNNYIHMGYYP